MSAWFALADGTIVDCIMREDEPSRRYTSVVQWRIVVVTDEDEEWSLARRITTTTDLAAAFAKAVESYFDSQSRLG